MPWLAFVAATTQRWLADVFATLRKILALLSPGERRRGALVMVMVMIMAALETAGVASVMPFLAVLGNPGIIDTNPVLAFLYERLGFASTDAFLFALGGAAFVLVIFGALFRTVTLYAMHRFTQMRRHSVGERLLETYLRQPYAFFLDRHSGDLAKSILSEVDQLIDQVFRPGFEVLAYGVVLLAMITLLLIVDPVLALVIAGVIGGLYGVVFVVVRGVLGRIGIDRVNANRERFTAAGEALGGIKSIKLLGREQAYLSRFRGPSIRQAQHQATNRVLSDVPKYLIEAVGFGGVIALALVLMATRDGIGDVLPILGLYAFAGYRMLPAAQHVYRGMAKLRFGAAAVDTIHEDLERRTSLAEIPASAPRPLRPRESIRLVEIDFRYPGTTAPALAGINLAIPAGSSVGIVGGTGAGKTTLVDVVLGLLQPTAGRLEVDGTPVTADNVRAWQQSLGYVPQDIFLTDTSIAENIALGVPPEQVDHDKVVECARMAQLDDFVTRELAHGYATEVGERGVRLSGGQRQRIGIARALYHDPDVLVFDEATSALDNRTEASVMEAIEALSGSRTIIMIAHRLTTVRHCDRVLLLDKGHIAADGTFDELTEQSEKFRDLAR